jgi:hypothetical protein
MSAPEVAEGLPVRPCRVPVGGEREVEGLESDDEGPELSREAGRGLGRTGFSVSWRRRVHDYVVGFRVTG